MRALGPILILLGLTTASCTRPGGPYPSLAPRAGEALDPRVPVTRPLNDRSASEELVARLGELVVVARRGDASFGPAVVIAQRLAAAAGAPQSESWILAQQALSAAIAARAPTASAAGDIDALAAAKLQSAGGIAPNDLNAIDQAAAVVATIDTRQSETIAAIQRRLGI